MLVRDVENMTHYYGQFAPELLLSKYAQEMWALYESGELTFETELTGLFEESNIAADVDNVIEEIKAAFIEEQDRLERIAEANEIDDSPF